MNKKQVFKRFLSVLVLTIAVFVFIGCGKKVSTKDYWDDFVKAYNEKDLTALGKAYYNTDSDVENWVKNNVKSLGNLLYTPNLDIDLGADEEDPKSWDSYVETHKEEIKKSYFGDITIETLKYDELTYCDFSTDKKVEKYYAATVELEITNNGKKSTETFDIYYLQTEAGLVLVSEIVLNVISDAEYEAISNAVKADLATCNANAEAALNEAYRLDDEKFEKQDLLDQAKEGATQEEVDRLNAEIQKIEEEYAPLIAEQEKIQEENENKASKLEEKEEVINSLAEKTFGQVPTNLWIEHGYFETSKYLYQREFYSKYLTEENEASDYPMYGIVISKQQKNDEKVKIPEIYEGYPVTKIANYAFYRNSRVLTFTTKSSDLEEITFPNTLREIGKSAFYQCGKLEEINIPQSVVTIGSNAFASCVDMETIRINPDDSGYAHYIKRDPVQSKATSSSKNIIEISGAYKTVYRGDILELTATGKGVDTSNITWTVSAGAKLIKTDYINKVRVVFESLTATEVTITAYDNQNRTDSSSVTVNLELPTPVMNIDATAFDRCNNLEEFYITTRNPYAVNVANGTQFSLSSKATIYVPKGCAENYKNSVTWSKYANQIKEFDFDAE